MTEDPKTGAIAHDLNNLLTSIKGLSALVLKDLPSDHPLRADMEEIHRAAQRAAALTRQLPRGERAADENRRAADENTRTANDSARAADENTRAADDSERAGQDAEAGGSETILVVDDDASVRHLVNRVLERAGYHVLQAENAEAALGLAEEHEGRIDLLLTDVVMPGMDGQELWARVCDRWPGVRLLYMSGYTDNPVVRREAADPAGAFLPKPFAPEALLAATRRALDREHKR